MVRAVLHYDVVSPWTLFAYAVLKRYRQQWDMDLVLKPVFLGGVMNAAGNKPPITVPNKGKWMNQSDMPLAAQFFEVPYQFPTKFPLNTIHCMRLLRSIEEIAPEKLEKATDLFYGAIWQPTGGKTALDAIDPSNFASMLAQDNLFSKAEIDKVVELSTSDKVKGLLKSESQQAVDEGAFGFPWIVVERDDGEKRSFFGSDRFETIAFWLGKEWKGPVPEGRKGGKAKL
ncbi:thioredoxin-like protein [Rhodotorula diobovata]|uniref:Glutathione S-transferase kappa n=1 Tax=Rhodotorula diobovata TaxID=5288 RepID=A0A5C5G5L9_9BASI|nr:thioredoxin-like protein [Rhodotorula diobovata]